MDLQLPGTIDDEIKRTMRVLQMLLLLASSPEKYTRKRLWSGFRLAGRR